MRIWTRYELEQFEAVFNTCMSVALAYDKSNPIQLNQIRHGNPSKELPKASELPTAHRNLIIKLKGLDNFANLFCPLHKKTTMPRLIKYLCENHARNGVLHVRDFELSGPVWVDKEQKRAFQVVYEHKT